MAKPVGSLVVRIGANTSGLTRGGRRMETTMQRWRRQANETSKRMALIGGAAAGAALAISSKLVKSQIDAIDKLQKTSQLLGESTKNMAGLQFAAEQTGVATTQLNMGLQRMTRRVAEAADGTGEAKDAIKQLGLDAQALNELSPAQQFREVAAAMEQVENRGTKVRLAFKLFDSEGAALLNTLDEGASGLDRFQRMAEELGIALSSVEARQVVAAQDALGRVSAAMTGISRTATVELAPVIETVADKFVDAAKGAGGFRQAVVDGMEGAAIAVAHIINAVKGIQIAWEGVKVAFHFVVGSISQGLADLLALNRKVNNAIIDGVNKVIEMWNKLGVAQMDTVDRLPVGKWERNLALIGGAAESEIDKAIAKMHELAMSGANPDQIRKQFQIIREEAKKAAEEISESASGAGADGEGDGDENAEEERKKRREKLQQRLEDIRKAGLSQLELEQEQFEQRMEWIREAKERELITEQEFRTRKEDVEAQHQKRMNEIEQRGLSDREKFERASMTRRVGMMASDLSQMTSTVAGENKKMFKLNKAAALAEATVSMFTGAERTMSAYPYPWNIPMVAAHLATSAARISKIKSTSFSGGGGTAPSVSGSTPSGSQPVTETGGGGGERRVVNPTFNIQGESISKRAFREMVEGLNDTLDDGAELGTVRVN